MSMSMSMSTLSFAASTSTSTSLGTKSLTTIAPLDKQNNNNNNRKKKWKKSIPPELRLQHTHNTQARAQAQTPPSTPRMCPTPSSTATTTTTTTSSSSSSSSQKLPLTPPRTPQLPPPACPQFTLFVHHLPASWTIALLLQELGLTYTLIPVGVPNNTPPGRPSTPPAIRPEEIFPPGLSNTNMPVLVDHSNKDKLLLDPGQMIMYLVDRYGAHRKSALYCPPPDSPADILARRWLSFALNIHSHAASKAMSFLWAHPYESRVPVTLASALHNAWSVLDKAIANSPSGFLLSEGISWADVVVWSWSWVWESGGLGEEGGWDRFPALGRWAERMGQREGVRSVVGEWERVKLEYV